MLIITIPGGEFWNKATREFEYSEPVVLELEHSLVSLSKWESSTEKPYLKDAEKTSEEVLFYVQCMCLTPNVSPEVFSRLSKENADLISTYIDAKMTATWFSDDNKKPSSQTITSELIYSWMVDLGIDFQTQYWHLNRLITLIKVLDRQHQPKKKVAPADEMAQRRALNKQRLREAGLA